MEPDRVNPTVQTRETVPDSLALDTSSLLRLVMRRTLQAVTCGEERGGPDSGEEREESSIGESQQHRSKPPLHSSPQQESEGEGVASAPKGRKSHERP